MNKPGFYHGQHYSTYVEEVRELKRGEQWGQAEQLLLKLIEATEAEARVVPMGIVAPWYYENLAIIYHKQKNALAELAILDMHLILSSKSGWRKLVCPNRCVKITTGQRLVNAVVYSVVAIFNASYKQWC